MSGKRFPMKVENLCQVQKYLLKRCKWCFGVVMESSPMLSSTILEKKLNSDINQNDKAQNLTRLTLLTSYKNNQSSIIQYNQS